MNGEFFRQADYSGLSQGFAQECFKADRAQKANSTFDRRPTSSGAQSTSKSRLITINAGSVKPRNIDFLWAGRLARGKHTCFAGEGGLGKSQLLVNAAATLTTGGL